MNIFSEMNVEFDYMGLFSSEEKWIHPDRTEKTWELIYVTDGTVCMHDEKVGDMTLDKGMLAVLEKGVRHYGNAESSGVSFYWLHFNVSDGLPFKKRFFEKIDSPHLFKEILHYSFLSQRPDYLINSILLRILAELRFLEENAGEEKNRLAEAVYEWVRVNACGRLTAKNVAEHFGFSSDHISRIVKKQYGLGLKTIIDNFTLAKAKEMLANTEKYVKEIAAEVGFADDKAFVGFFKYHEGIYPSEFRNRFYGVHMNKK